MRFLNRLLLNLGVAGAYYLTAVAGLQLALPLTNATAVWVSSGIGLAALLLGGLSLVPGIALGALVANVQVLLLNGAGGTGKVMCASAVIAAGNTIEALLARLLYRRWIGRPDPLKCSRDPLILAALAGISCLVAAAIGVATVTTMGFAPRELATHALLTWWLGDLAGILMIVPMALLAPQTPALEHDTRSILAQAVFLIGVGLAAFALFAGGISHELAASVAYLVIPLVLVTAIWDKAMLTQLSVVVIATAAIYGAVHGQGPFARPSVHPSLLLAQAFICVLALAGSTLNAAITDGKTREQSLQRTYRALQVLTRCNAAVVHAADELQLLKDVCRVAVDTAGYQLACVGYAQNDEGKSVKPMAFAGPAERFLSRVRVSWGDDEYGQGTLGAAIRTARAVVACDLPHHPDYRAWHDLVVESGFRSAAAVPLQSHGTMYGAIVFYTREPQAFASSEVELLRELGENLAHGILTLRAQHDNAMLYRQVQQHAAELEQRVQERTAQLEQEMAQRERAQTSLRESERKYRELVENANSIILRMDTRGYISFLNEFGQRFFGYPEQELLGRSVIGTIVPETESSGRDLAQLIQDTAAHPDRHPANENQNMRRDGTRVWISWTNRPIYDREGRMIECLAVGNDITVLKQAEADLERAKEAAESADRLKSAFLATMSHELRTPLNSIIGFTGIILQELPGPLNSEQRKQLEMVQIAARHLLALITDVLDISKIEAGQLSVQRASFSLPTMIDKVIETVRPLARAKDLQLVCQIAADVGDYCGDQRRVAQILLNLLSNAIKFTQQGQVMLCCTCEPQWVAISVRDTGCGIAQEDHDTIFRPFRQLDTGLARQHEGTGLGLAICKRLLDIMGGGIELSSEVGKGSVFTVRLPRQEPQTQRERQ